MRESEARGTKTEMMQVLSRLSEERAINEEEKLSGFVMNKMRRTQEIDVLKLPWVPRFQGVNMLTSNFKPPFQLGVSTPIIACFYSSSWP